MKKINIYKNKKVFKFWRFFDNGTFLTFLICFMTGRLIAEAISNPWYWFGAAPLSVFCLFYLSGIIIYKNNDYVR